jgi:hypothetical protein
VASIGNGAAFRKGREFAARMGLLPKQHSTGGKATLYGVSKRGNSYALWGLPYLPLSPPCPADLSACYGLIIFRDAPSYLEPHRYVNP